MSQQMHSSHDLRQCNDRDCCNHRGQVDGGGSITPKRGRHRVVDADTSHVDDCEAHFHKAVEMVVNQDD